MKNKLLISLAILLSSICTVSAQPFTKLVNVYSNNYGTYSFPVSAIDNIHYEEFAFWVLDKDARSFYFVNDDVDYVLFTDNSKAKEMLAKTWTWDTEFRNGESWGNCGYLSDNDGANWANIWWGCAPEDLSAQLDRYSDTGIATGEEDPNAYMIFSEDGFIRAFDANGNEIRSGKFDVTAWDNGNRTISDMAGYGMKNWSLGILTTDAGSILWPFQINGGGYKPRQFEIMMLDDDHLQLIYAPEGTVPWEEATWWAFKARK